MRIWRTTTVALGISILASGLAHAQGYDKKTIEKMLSDGAKKLGSADATEREEGAGFILGYITCDYRGQYLPVVVKALKDSSPEVRKRAAQTLEKVQAKEAIPDLVALLDDPIDDVRERAAYALGAIGDRSAEPGLRKAKDTAHAQHKSTLELTMQEGLDEISGKSVVDHPKCP